MMQIVEDKNKTKEQLISELTELHRQVSKLGASETERKAAGEALRGSENRYRLVAENAADAIWTVNINMQPTYFSPSIARLLGYSVEEAMAKSMDEVFTPDSFELAMKVLTEELAIEKAGQKDPSRSRTLEFELKRKDGSIVPVEIKYSFLREPDGQPVEILAIARDITERKKAEEALRKSEQKYSALVEQGNDGIVIIQESLIKFANLKMAETIGFSLEEMLGSPFLDFISPPQRGLVANRYKRRMSGEEVANRYEIEAIAKDGRKMPLEISASVIEYEGRPADMGIVRDITERKQARQQVEQAAQEWRTTFDSITDLVSIHDSNSRITRVNRAFASAFKMEPQEILGRTCYELVHGTKEPRPDCPHRQTLATGEPSWREFFEPHLGIHMEVACSPVFDERGGVNATVHIVRDITERKKMEGQLIVTDRLASVGELASGVAHELNNPLTGIIGFAELLLDKDVPGDIKEDLKIIHREAQRTSRVVRNLLTFARKHEPAKQTVNLNCIIQKVLEIRAYEQKVNNIQVNTRFAPDLPEILADGFELQQVFLNIIINAEYFMTVSYTHLTLPTKRIV